MTDAQRAAHWQHHARKREGRISLLRVEERDLHVEDLDAGDGTPVLDLAPWFAEFGIGER
ncbi:hypothetical protein [Nocardiopsis tropica]|uniref:Uncharacterized protein n=1 Tax=Nocardiopsis tropica TaxID=109330 RepID=A0ABU7KVA9_9ACTN|nr:hypothetical protein [Nocardiopsis umidischolae]MEE2053209.1 hypothetical protein [Nocardiopsis umidischolae]